jgi:hypothetical protein
MKKIYIILPAIALLSAACQSATSNSALTPSISNNASSTATVTAQKFSDSPDYQNAFLISGDTLSQTAQQALTGFQISRQMQMNGSIKINLKATETGYQDKQYTLAPGQQLYFIDKTLGDDQASEGNVRDDYGIVVDGQGFIVGSEQ